MNCMLTSEVLVSKLLAEDEHHCVVSVPATRVDLHHTMATTRSTVHTLHMSHCTTTLHYTQHTSHCTQHNTTHSTCHTAPNTTLHTAHVTLHSLHTTVKQAHAHTPCTHWTTWQWYKQHTLTCLHYTHHVVRLGELCSCSKVSIMTRMIQPHQMKSL